MNRIVGTIADGATDHKLVFHFVECIITKTGCQPDLLHTELSQTLSGVTRRFQKNRENQNFSVIGDKAAIDARSSIENSLLAGYAELQDRAGRELSNEDLLIISTDTEMKLKNIDRYFQPWVRAISEIFLSASERFYHLKMAQGHMLSDIPRVGCIPFFPSTDIIVAAARGDISSMHERHPQTLKQMLYGTKELRELSHDEFEEHGVSLITTNRLEGIYGIVPETRVFANQIR